MTKQFNCQFTPEDTIEVGTNLTVGNKQTISIEIDEYGGSVTSVLLSLKDAVAFSAAIVEQVGKSLEGTPAQT